MYLFFGPSENEGFLHQYLGLEFVSEEKDRYIFLKAGQSMLLIFNPNKTLARDTQLPTHGAFAPPSIIHFALEINEESYGKGSYLGKGCKFNLLLRPSRKNLVEIITPGSWPVDTV